MKQDKSITEVSKKSLDASLKVEAIRELILGENIKQYTDEFKALKRDIEEKKKVLEDLVIQVRKEVLESLDNISIDTGIRISELEERIDEVISDKMDFRILPSKSLYIDEKILIGQWESILRLLCSIKLKETKPSKVLGRLSSYSKQHPLYKALKELGRIFKSIFILRYLDEKPLRQGIEKQLNRIEQSHQFAKAVFFGNNQEFKFETKEEQEISVGCRHLIQNAIVLWNYMHISGKLAETTNKEEHNGILESLTNSSIMTWQHVNLHGEYDFNMTQNTSSFDIEKILSLKLNTEGIRN